MSSSEVSLLQIPDIPMKNILEYLDFQSILVLRKVCHDLRNFIDITKPAFHLTKMWVKANASYVIVTLHFSRPPFSIRIDYLKKRDGCWVKCYKKLNVKETILKDEDFVTVFCKDFDIILRHQKTVLGYFESLFNSPNSRVKERILESVNKSLKSLNHPLQVETIVMKVKNHNEIMPILPYIDPKPLETIFISDFRTKKVKVVLNLDEVGQLEQWKEAKELVITGFQVPYLSQNFKYFSCIDFGYREVSLEELILLKEIFLCSSTLNTIQLNNLSKALLIKQQMIEEFGQPFLGNNQLNNWFFRIPETNQFLRIQHKSIFTEFKRIELSEVPQNAIILN